MYGYSMYCFNVNSPLFKFADVNAFLAFAATRHTHTAEYLRDTPGVARILEAAKAGHVPVGIVSSMYTFQTYEHRICIL